MLIVRLRPIGLAKKIERYDSEVLPMSARSDRIQSLIARVDRPIEPTRSRDSQLQGSQRFDTLGTLEIVHCDAIADAAILTALDSSVAEVNGDATRNKPPPRTPVFAKFCHPRQIRTASISDSLIPTRSISPCIPNPNRRTPQTFWVPMPISPPTPI